jgi:hypothetical protein
MNFMNINKIFTWTDSLLKFMPLIFNRCFDFYLIFNYYAKKMSTSLSNCDWHHSDHLVDNHNIWSKHHRQKADIWIRMPNEFILHLSEYIQLFIFKNLMIQYWCFNLILMLCFFKIRKISEWERGGFVNNIEARYSLWCCTCCLWHNMRYWNIQVTIW